jgi:crotonobetainyl-CoA:carnitine CoA-transferase CaiB-like acyl-CoA transferase
MNKPTPLGKKSYAEYEREMKKFKNSTEVNLNKTYKINLSAVDDISEYLGTASYIVGEAFEEAMDKGDEQYMLGRDMMRFDFSDNLGSAEELINDMEATLSELGVDTPSELQDAKKTLEELRTARDRSRDRFGKWDSIY